MREMDQKDQPAQPAAAQPCRDRKGSDYVKYVKSYRNWYARHTNRLWWIWLALQVTAVLASLAVALIAILPNNMLEAEIARVTVGIAGLIAALCTTLTAQFRVHDLWRLREEGRVTAQEILDDVRLFYDFPFAPADEARLRKSINERLVKLEWTQQDRFFALSASRPVRDLGGAGCDEPRCSGRGANQEQAERKADGAPPH
jgi:hypothetical protein